MCGVVGLLLKNPDDRHDLGYWLTPMFQCMAERGTDSAGLAVFKKPNLPDSRRYSLFAPDATFDWQKFREVFCLQTGTNGQINPIENHAVLISDIDPGSLRIWLAECDPSPHILAVGRHIEVYKDQGHPIEIAKKYCFSDLSGSHAVGHTRMATESAVSPAHAHPYTAGEDFCLVHNGSFSNHHMLRRKLERQGLQFETDNDTEAACRYIEWRMQQGESLDDAIYNAFRELDGFYTLLMANDHQLTLVRDAFACKPAVVVESDRYVAISSEFRSLADLPDVKNAKIFEPKPEQIYSWKL